MALEETKREEIKTPVKKISVKKDQETKAKKVDKEPTPKKEVSSAGSADFAVIKTGGKQCIVRSGKKIEIEKLEIGEGESIKFDEVLLVKKGNDIKIGTPRVEGAIVEGKIVSQKKADKIIVFKYKKRKDYRVKQGHRQKITEVEILKF